MPKVRKVKRRQKYRFSVNRKRLKNKQRKGPSIQCKEIKDAWTNKKSVRKNMEEMGLIYDPNTALKIPSTKELLHPEMKEQDEGKMDVDGPSKNFVAEKLEAEAKAPRVRKFRLPKNEVQWLSYLIKKYGEDYKAMARDPKNHYQETWKQLRGKIKTFKAIPEQYEEFLESLTKEEAAT
ncbi:nucleolar protein 16 [Anabrus simplex]|uniref:nucleolar protein 16 n=1 Tax=Anabrus simplex TaxID=316456 RepID=UPI0034DD4056